MAQTAFFKAVSKFCTTNKIFKYLYVTNYNIFFHKFSFVYVHSPGGLMLSSLGFFHQVDIAFIALLVHRVQQGLLALMYIAFQWLLLSVIV